MRIYRFGTGQDSTGNEGAGFQWKLEKWGALPMEMGCASDGNVVRFRWKCGALLVERGASSGNRGASTGAERNGGPK